jgi:hypothetical protein
MTALKEASGALKVPMGALPGALFELVLIDAAELSDP